MQNCKICGAPNRLDAANCAACGAPLAVESQPQIAQPMPQQPSGEQGQPPYAWQAQKPYSAQGQPPYAGQAQQPYSAQGQPPYAGQAQQPYSAQGQPPYAGQAQQPYSAQGQPPYGGQVQQPYSAQGQPPYGGQVQQPYGAQMQPPPKSPKKRKMALFLGLGAGALAVVILVVVLVMNYTPVQTPEPPIVAPSVSVEESVASSQVESVAAPSSVPQDEGYVWVSDTLFIYKDMAPIFNAYYNTDAFKYVVVRDGDKVSLASFGTNPVGIFEFYEGGGVYLCTSGSAHGFPDYIEDEIDIPARNALISEKGITLSSDGNHGSYSPIIYVYDGGTGKVSLAAFEMDGQLHYIEQAIPDELLPPYLMTLDSEDVGSGGMLDNDEVKFALFTRDGEQLLPFEYDNITNLYGEVALLQLGGKWGYYDLAGRRLISDCVWDPVWQNSEYGSMPGFYAYGLCPVVKDGKYGVMDMNGSMVVEPQFQGITHVYNRYVYVKKGEYWGMIQIK